MANLLKFTKSTMDWNKNIYSNILSGRKKTTKRRKGLQKAIEIYDSENRFPQEIIVRAELAETLYQEEL